MNIKIDRSYEICQGCGGRQAKRKILAEYSGSEIHLCNTCCEKLKKKI